MANTLNTPDVLTQPIATNGTKNAIPNTNDQSLGLMSQSTGFPAICSERIADGGKAPRRADFNGAFNLVSQHHFFLQNGGTETFRQSVSDAIGGYPINSRLWFTNSNGESVIVRSLIANNTYNFNNDPTYIDGIKWVVDVESGAPVGSLMPYAGTTPPDGWLICDGSEISRTTYARLFSVIGTTYGAGDGNSSFNIPNLSPSRRVIESQEPTSANSYKGYRLYDDGWIEQSGVATITANGNTVSLPKEMANTTYPVFSISLTNTNSFNRCYSRSATGISIATSGGNYSSSWRIEGMSARGASQQTRYIIKY